MKNYKNSGMIPLVVMAVAGLLLASGQVAAECQWPMKATILATQSEYPTYTNLEFTKAAGDEIVITETTIIELGGLVQEFPAMVQSSAGFADLQGRLNCHNRADDFGYDMHEAGGFLYAGFSANVEKFWCSSMDVPCPTWSEPLRMCRKDSNGKVWGARVKSVGQYALVADGSGLDVKNINVVNTNDTSAEQNFVRDLFGGSLLGVIGIDLIRKIEKDALSQIGAAMKEGFSTASFRLQNGNAVPEIPTYEPKVVDSKFTQVLGANGQVVAAQVVRRQDNYPQSTGCFVARNMDATTIGSYSR